MKRHLATGGLIIALAFPSVAAAQGQGPFRLSLSYDGTLVVKVLDMKIEQTVSDGGFSASARMKSYGVLALFKRLDVRADSKGRLDGGEARPAQFNHVNLDGAVNRAVEVRWGGGDVTTSARPLYPSLGDPAPTRPQKLSAADPLTQIMRIALSPPGARPCTGAARMFDGRQLYAVEFSAAQPREPTARETAQGLVSPVRCKLAFNEVAGFDAKPAHKKNQGLKGPVTIDFARVGADGPWIISTVRGRTPLGDAVIEIRSVRAEGVSRPQLLTMK